MQFPQAAEFDITLAQICQRALSDNPLKVLLNWRQASLTVSDVIRRASDIAEALDRDGINQHEPVGVMLDNHPDHVATLLALGLLGVIWVPLDRRFKAANIQRMLTQVSVKTVIAERAYQDVVHRAYPGCVIHCLDDITGSGDRAVNHFVPRPTLPEDVRALMFTSGTTGAAKAVIVTERMYTGAALFCGYASQADTTANFYLWEPLNHIGGAQIIPMALFSGATVSMTDRFSASRFWSEVRNSVANRIHYLGGILELLLANPPSPSDFDHQVKLAFGAGANATISKAFTSRFGIPLREVYGMTEAASFTTININGPAGSIGKPLEFFSLSLRDKFDQEVVAGQVGEITLASKSIPLLTEGYYKNSAATSSAIRKGRFFTGDLAYEDEDGFLYFCGRLKDRIRCKGENVSAAEIETVFNAHPDIVDTAVIGIDAELGEQDIVAFVQITSYVALDDTNTRLQPIVNWVDEQLASFQQPRFIVVVEDFPRTPSERIEKHKLLPTLDVLEYAWDRRATSRNAPCPESD